MIQDFTELTTTRNLEIIILAILIILKALINYVLSNVIKSCRRESKLLHSVHTHNLIAVHETKIDNSVF